jgi:hypothetical protein
LGFDSRVAVLIGSQLKKPLLLDGKLSFKMWTEEGEERRRMRRGTQGPFFWDHSLYRSTTQI